MKALATLAMAMMACAGADGDPIQVLMRVRDQVVEHRRHIPNHMCVETISRDRYEYTGGPAPRSCDELLGRRKRAGTDALIRLATTDRVRLDVGVAATHEMYSWPGAGRFDEREIEEFVPLGAIGTGPFASMLSGIFDARDPDLAWEGETLRDSRRLLRYSFRMPQEESLYKAKAGVEWVIAGYTGTLLVDAGTAGLVELSVRTDELPAATHTCEVDSTMEYGTVRLEGQDYLLPAVARQRFIQPDGREDENTIRFGQCREFQAESAVSFGESGGGASGKGQAGTAATAGSELPAGVPVTVELTSTVDSDQAAAGDRVEGRLAGPIRDPVLTTVLALAGSLVRGRLKVVETRHGRSKEVTIGLAWDRIAVNGVEQPLRLAPDGSAGNWSRPMAGESAYAVYRSTGEHVVVKGGLKSHWFTASP